MMNYILETQHLSKKSGNSYRVKDLSLSVPGNAFTAF